MGNILLFEELMFVRVSHAKEAFLNVGQSIEGRHCDEVPYSYKPGDPQKKSNRPNWPLKKNGTSMLEVPRL